MNDYIAQQIAQSLNDYPDVVNRVIVIINGQIQYEFEDHSALESLECALLGE